MEDQEKVFWVLIRRALIMILKAIEKRYGIGSGKQAAPDGATDE